MKNCTIEDCTRPHKGHGLCDMHLQRARRTGTTASPVKSLEDRFWAKVDKDGPILVPALGPCWVWTAATKDGGYGVIRPEGRRTGPVLKAHRVSLELSGVAVDGYVVRHRCDNPPCVNPAHLELGTQLDNVADIVERGRIARGERISTKLTAADVREIRVRAAVGETQNSIAASFGITRSNVSVIVSRRSWAHVA